MGVLTLAVFVPLAFLLPGPGKAVALMGILGVL
jgi:hypothetical protein